MKSFFKLLEKTAGPIGLLTATAGAILDFLTPLGNYIYVLAAILLLLTVLSAICSKSNPILQKVKNSTAFAPDFIKNELVELWQPDGVAFWKKGLFQVLTFLTTLSLGAGVYAKDNPNGFLATKIDSVANLQTSLGLIDSKISDISAKQDKIIEGVEIANNKLDLVKKETSENPRKELANLGITWDDESFTDAMIKKDGKEVALFLNAGYKLKLSPESAFTFAYDYIDKNGDITLLKQAIEIGAIDKDSFLNFRCNVDKLNMLTKLKLPINDVYNYNKMILDKKIKTKQEKNIELDNSDFEYPGFYSIEARPLIIAIWMKKQNFVDYFISIGADKNNEVIYVYDYEKFKDTVFKNSFNIDIASEAKKNGISIN